MSSFVQGRIYVYTSLVRVFVLTSSHIKVYFTYLTFTRI